MILSCLRRALETFTKTYLKIFSYQARYISYLDKITSADARVPFPQGKGTKGCRGPARFPCGAPAPGPPSDKYLVSVEPRRGAPDGVPFGSALTAPLKTFRFQRGPVLRGGKARRVKDALCAWNLLSRGTTTPKASPERGGAREAGGGVSSPAPQGRGGSVRRRDHNQA